jgi:hypothetical protein
MMGSLASLDDYVDWYNQTPMRGNAAPPPPAPPTGTTYDPMSDRAVERPEPPQDPRAFTSEWARASGVYPGAFEPKGTQWPQYPPPPPKEVAEDRPNPLIPFSAYRSKPPTHRVGDIAAQNIIEQGFGALPAGRLGMGAALTLDPSPAEGGSRGIPHGIGQFNLRDTALALARQNRHVPTKVIQEASLQPHDIPVGSWLTPLVGDRSRSGELLTHVGERELRNPVWMQGGYQFVPEWQKQGVAWGSDRSPTSTIAGRVRGFQEETPNVYGVYTAMGPQSVDASHHMSDTLSQLLHGDKKNISEKAAEQYDAAMRNIMPDFPGIKSEKLQAFMRQQPMSNRNVFAKGMGSASAREAGFPDVSQARIAVTHPDLLDVPMYSGGQSIAKLTGDVTHGSPGFGIAPHYTYRSKLHGQYEGGFDAPVPKELLWRDFSPKVGARNPSAAGKIWLTGLEGEPFGQLVDKKWQDSVAEYLRRSRMGDIAAP